MQLYSAQLDLSIYININTLVNNYTVITYNYEQS